MSEGWKWPGSRWWRVDLHAHSPESHDFGSPEDRKQKDWARWVESARVAGLDAIAVTDHNTGAGIGGVQEAAQGEDSAVIVYPGVEITASCGAHLLFIVDPGAGREQVDHLLSLAGVDVGDRGSRDARSPKSVEEILKLGGECDGVFLGAHVNGASGLLEHGGRQRIQELKHVNLLGVEVDPGRPLDESWIDGTRPEIGRRLPRIWASDGHRFDELGRRFTWVKMTRPDLEGLRLALTDGDSSLKVAARETPGDPNVHGPMAIECVRVLKAKHMGRPEALEFRFNPWLNAIVGGRGTGKSTLVDFMRKTLRRDKELEGTTLADAFQKRLRVGGSRRDEGLLTTDTRVELVYRKDGERYRISWDVGGQATPIQRLSGQDSVPEEGDVRERFPVRIYSQKQLFELAQDPNALLEVIDDSAEVAGKVFARKLREVSERYLSIQAEARAARTRAADLPNRRAEREDVGRKLEVLQQAGSAEALTAFRTRRRQDGTWRSIWDEVERALIDLAEAAERLAVAEMVRGSADDDGEFEHLEDVHETLERIVGDVKDRVSTVLSEARSQIDELRDGPEWTAWRRVLSEVEAEYERVADELASSGISSPDEYRELVERAADLDAEIERLDAARARAGALEAEAAGVLTEFRELAADRTAQRRSFVENVSSDSLLRVEVVAHADRDQEKLVASLRETLRIDRFDRDYEQLAERLRLDPGTPWTWTALDRIVAQLRALLAGGDSGLAAQDARFLTALGRLHPEQVDRLALFMPDDAVEVSFRDHGKPASGWTPLAQGSPGQQTAALLAFVLGYGTEPIVLDQPEDDLDSTLIYELLVQRLRETKSARQVIAVTHNPNIVVHGDAEFVISLEAKKGQSRIACQGGLQERAVRDEICRVMEGGRDAFEARYRRIMPRFGGRG